MRHNSKNLKKARRTYICTVSMILLAAVFSLCIAAWYASEQYADNVLRLHVIANSNTSEDQALKLKVRDKIGSVVSLLAAEAENADETERIVKENIEVITEAAQQEIYNEGFHYTVSVETGEFYFPTKYYDGGALPAGDYEAVRVVIGEGKGENWWCVLFPPLCFSNGGSYTQTNDGAERQAENVTVRFKIVELFQETRHSIGNLIQKIFK